MDILDFMQHDETSKPLAERMRPTVLDEFVGQEHIVGKGNLLRRAIEADKLGSCIFYGPPGCGKTTLASIIANTTKSNFVKLNAVSSGVADAKKVIEDAEYHLKLSGKPTYLMLDECHRWNKAQSDSVLAAIEKGSIIFIGSTTENPFVSMTRAIISRCRVFEFKKLSGKDIINALQLALESEKGLKRMKVVADQDALAHIAWASDGDLRSAYNALELAAVTTPLSEGGIIHIDKDNAVQSIQKKALSFDESMYYDMISAFCKSLRGSDSDAALYWSERLIQGGCDPLMILRRLIAIAAEDVGMADPYALTIAVSAMQAYERLGLPEGRIPLANAIIYVCEASKSNSVIVALDAAKEAAVNTKDDNVPVYLQDRNFKNYEVSGYKYPHDYGGFVKQQYLPDTLKDANFYQPSKNGYEKNLIRAKIIEKNKN